MKRILVLFLILSAQVACGQDFPPLLVANFDGKEQPLKLAKVDALIRIMGTLAETRMTMTFQNPNNRQLAGDLYFPLPEGSTVSGYGLDVQGTIVEGVVVEKTKGREVFEQEVRKGVDPGLVEWVKGNNYKTRVYPIPPQGTRTVMVKYISELGTAGGETFFHLPMNFKEKVDSFSLRMEVIKGQVQPVVKEGDLSNFAFSKWNEGFLAEASLKNREIARDLRILIPDAPKQSVLTENSGGETYFCVNDIIGDTKSLEEANIAKTPRSIVILWDASASRFKSEHKRELDLLKAYFSSLKGAKVEVDLVLFRNAAGKPIHLTVSGGIEALENEINTVDYDGGTQMGCIYPLQDVKTPDFFFLFTDGVSNFGKEEPGQFSAPLYIFSGDSSANHPFLRYLAARNGGEYFNLNRVETASILPAIGKPAFSYISATCDDKEITEVYPKVPQAVHGKFVLAGKISGNAGKISINYGVNGKVLKKTDYAISAGKSPDGDFLQRFWAQKKVEDLQIFPQRNEKEMISVGKKYGIVTPQTSLIVLENPDQYVEHEIVPPSTKPDWRKRYFEVVEQRAATKKQEEDSKISEVVRMWNDRVTWWNTEYKVEPGFKVRSGDKKGRRREDPSDAFDDAPGSSMPRSGGEVDVLLDAHPAPEPVTEADSSESLSAGSGGRARESRLESKSRENSPGGAPVPEKPVEPGVAMKAWNPQTPYIKNLKEAKPDRVFPVYMHERKEYGNSPAFFLDCADFFLKEKQDDLALQVLSNIAELEMENPALIRVLAHRLAQIEKLDLSAMMFEEVLKIRPEEPQSYRDLALVLGRMNKFDRAVELLYDVVKKRWDGRFPELEVIALMELNDLLVRAKAGGTETFNVDSRLIKLLDVDLRIIMTWDADMTDMDLWVTEPTGEKTYYGHNRSTIGGNVSRDFTRGYGPEEYCLKKGMRGMYKVETNFFGSTAQSLSGAVTLQVDVFTNFGRPNEKRRSITMRLSDRKDTFTIADVEF